MNRFWKILTSLRITVALLAFSVLLVFFGTLAQVDHGLWKAQEIWFRSYIVTMQRLPLFDWRFLVPIFPGGRLIGFALTANLVAAFLKRFSWKREKIGIHFIHGGVILLLFGQLATEIFSTESHLRLKEGETRNFSEDHLKDELAFSADTADGKEVVVAIPESKLKAGTDIKTDKLPFTVRVKQYAINSQLRRRGPMVDGPAVATQGSGTQLVAEARPEANSEDSRNMPFAYIELLKDGQSLGTWLVSPWLELFGVAPQEITVDGKKYRTEFRFERYYQPFSVTMLKATNESYPGTDIPKNFRSRIRIADSTTNEAREVDIYMNHPLRYAGQTFYQYQMSSEEMNERGAAAPKESTLEVVHNPGWLTPYAGCYIVAIGMYMQFRQHLTRFLGKRLGTDKRKGRWGGWIGRLLEVAVLGYLIFRFTLKLFGYY